MNKKDKDIRVIGKINGIPVWYHEEQNENEIVVSFCGVEPDPNAGRIMFLPNDGSPIRYEDGKPEIPHKAVTVAQFIVTGIKDFMEFEKIHGKKILEQIAQKLEIYNKTEKNVESENNPTIA